MEFLKLFFMIVGIFSFAVTIVGCMLNKSINPVDLLNSIWFVYLVTSLIYICATKD